MVAYYVWKNIDIRKIANGIVLIYTRRMKGKGPPKPKAQASPPPKYMATIVVVKPS